MVKILFRDVKSLTYEEISQEIVDIENLLSMAENASIETFLQKKNREPLLEKYNLTMTPNGEFFSVEKSGFAAELMEEMFNDRKIYKEKAKEAKKKLSIETDAQRRIELEDEISRFNNLQMAKKVSLNSYYGSTGSEYFRFFDVRQASAVTTAGQFIIQYIMRKLNVYLNMVLKTNNLDFVVASDTDSVYLCLDKLVEKILPNGENEKIIDFLNTATGEDKNGNPTGPISKLLASSYNEIAQYTNALSQCMHMKRESICDVALFTGKKRYALSVWDMEGLRYKEPEIKVTGLDIVRSTSPAIVRKRLKEALKVILHKNENEIQDFVTNFREEFMKLPLNDISCPRGVHGLEAYATDGEWKDKTPFHVKASITYNRLLKKGDLTKKYQAIKNGEKIRYLYLIEPNPAHNEVIAYPMILPPEFGLDQYIDKKRQFEMTFLSPLRKLLDAVGWKEEEVASLKGMWSDD